MTLLTWELRRPFLAFAYQISREPQVLTGRHFEAAGANVSYWTLPPCYTFHHRSRGTGFDPVIESGLFFNISGPFIEFGLFKRQAVALSFSRQQGGCRVGLKIHDSAWNW